MTAVAEAAVTAVATAAAGWGDPPRSASHTQPIESVGRTSPVRQHAPPPVRLCQPQSEPGSPAGAAAAGAGYANRNQSQAHPRGCRRRRRGLCQPQPELGSPRGLPAAAGAGYANRNQGSAYPDAGCRRRGAGYANNHVQQYHPGMVNGYWNGTGGGSRAWARATASGVGAWGTGSPMYGWGYSGYSNPYSGGFRVGGVRRPRPCSSRRRRSSRGGGLQLLPADQHDRRAARAGRRRPGDLGVRPGPRGVQGGRLRQGPAARPAGTGADAQ